VASKTLTWTFTAASAAVVLWAGRAFFVAPEPPEPSVPAAPPAAPVAQAVTPAATPGSVGPAPVSPTPPGVTTAQWAALEAELQTRPDAAAERQRLIGYFGWADAVQRWRAARHDVALAGVVDAGLAQRLAGREVSAAEVRQLKAALLETLEPDAARRTAALQAFDASLPAPAGPDPRQRAFQQQQAALVAAWQTRPAAERDAAALARQLDALRRKHFAPMPASTPGR
jgi:hypothetical protein